jgi:hypothetical protein
VKYLRSIAHGFFVSILSAPTTRPWRLATRTRDAFNPRATLFSLIVVVHRSVPKRRA